MAEQLINPFGEDDDDFETNWLIDRNFQVPFAIYSVSNHIFCLPFIVKKHTPVLLFIHIITIESFSLYVCFKGVYDGGR